MATRFLGADEAARTIKDGDTVGICGSGAVLDVGPVLAAIERRFLAEGHPTGLTEVNPIIPGLEKGTGGLNHLAHVGLLKRLICGSYDDGRHPELHRMVVEGEIEAYNLPMGCAFQALRAAGGRRPGVLTRVGLGTYADPECGGCRMNAASPPGLVQRLVLDGEPYLFYRAIPLDVAIIRGTLADTAGNLSLRGEPAYLGVSTLALAAKAHGGIVIAQVGAVVEAGSLDPREVKVPGRLVDIVVEIPGQEQLPGRPFNPSICGDVRLAAPRLDPLPPGAKGIVLRRAARELYPGAFVNIGYGVFNSLPAAAAEFGLLRQCTFSIEHGQIGGIPGSAAGTVFPAAVNGAALIDSLLMFDIYDSGALEVAFLSFAQVDAQGDVNVAQFGDRRSSVGGFVNISQGARRIVFGGTLTTGGLVVACHDQRLKIVREGRVQRFVPRVKEVAFVAGRAASECREVLYVTERAVFRLTPSGIELAEIAPGQGVQDVQAAVGFPLRVARDLRPMDGACFVDQDGVGVRG